MTNALTANLRQKFDMAGFVRMPWDRSVLEDDILEKIINLSVLNPLMVPQRDYSIVAVRTEYSKKKLYDICGRQQAILEAAAVLIVAEGLPVSGKGSGCMHDMQRSGCMQSCQGQCPELINLAVAYAAMFYEVDAYAVKEYDPDSVMRVFFMKGCDMAGKGSACKPVTVICLGDFGDGTGPGMQSLLVRKAYCDSVVKV